MELLPQAFYERPADQVALDLLGKILQARSGGGVRRCRIVEVEAYFGPCDPASRARRGRRGRIARALHGPPGLTLVYGMHRQWLLNIVAHPPWMAGAVLLRSCTPLEPGEGNPRGPGRLTRYMGIGREMDSLPVYDPTSLVQVLDDGYRPGRVLRGGRIGVREDLELPLRFYIG
ncbi:MAG: DNA-3-methyladenine glycosylase [Desulfurococcales archaeon]|nr:DNA-3-methyladenine glycosylase [Desulfurococcales archaeon]